MALAVGTILVLALPPYSILPFALIAFAVLAIMLRGASWPIAFRLGYLFGLGQFVPGLFWITESFQVEADRFGWLALPAVFGLAALLAVFPALACALAARMARAGLPLSLSLATSWTGLEWLRGHVLTGFPWNLAAYTLADWLPFAQVASCRVAFKSALPQSVWRRGSILALNSSGPARPYMARLRVFRRLI